MKHTVLIVEDEDDLREMMRDALEFNGYTVVVAAEGQSALEKIDGIEGLCLILLDLVMPGMNGWDFYESLRRVPHLASVPVIVHSSSLAGAPLGITRVLRKPLAIERLLSVVQEYCAAGP